MERVAHRSAVGEVIGQIYVLGREALDFEKRLEVGPSVALGEIRVVPAVASGYGGARSHDRSSACPGVSGLTRLTTAQPGRDTSRRGPGRALAHRIHARDAEGVGAVPAQGWECG